jgi:hypothetical protein
MLEKNPAEAREQEEAMRSEENDRGFDAGRPTLQRRSPFTEPCPDGDVEAWRKSLKH